MLDLSREQIADLDPEQLEFLLRRLKKAGRKDAGEGRRQTIPRREGPGPWPLSFAQQRLWFIHQLEHRSAAYHIPIAVDLAGPLRPQLLKAALEDVAQRHEALRTTFELAGGAPVQVVHPRLDLPLPLLDLTALAGPAREAELSRLAEDESRRPFDLARGPLLRGLLVRREGERFRLLLTLHHVAADNWSVSLLMREVAAFYDSLALGVPLSLPELPVQYADFAVWQRQWLQGEVLDGQLDFWRRRLDGAPRQIELPSDRPRPEAPSFRSGRLVFRLPVELTAELKALGRQRGTTLYNTLLAAWNALLYRYTGQEDVVVGSPVANRRHTEIEGLIGFFVNTLLMRNRPEGRLSFEELLARVHEASLGAFAHQDLPFEKIVEDLRPDRDSSYQPLFQVMFNVYDGAMPELQFSGVEVEAVEVQIGTWNDLDLLLAETRQGLEGYLRYSADLFEASTAAALADSFRGLLETVVRDPRTRLADLPLSPALTAQAETARARNRKQRIVVSATFTAEPLEDSLAFWMRELDIPARVELAPYNQVFQQLLDRGSLLNGNRHGVNVVLVRWEDWAPEVERNADDLTAALEAAARRAAVPFLVVLCPSTPPRAELEERLRSALAGAANVHLVTEGELAALYPVADLHDPYADRLGHIPYSMAGFAALGTLISRKIHALVSPPAKVIVLDCDNTLWKGVCGEDGPLGVVLDPARKRLQELVLAQQQAGLLLCLCSKNEESDVWSTFDRRPDFPLRREHLTVWRINWEPKSKNLRSLAEELNLGLDSFVFLDDNPVECAEVRAACPEVMVLELPADDAAVPRTLEHFWAFDRLRTTAEDRERTELYRQMLERERHRRSAGSFEDFLAGLGLVIDVAPMAPEQLARVAQLTQRTNQFNASTIRRTEGEVQRLLDEGSLECRVVAVRDRFGDYGLVGVVFFAPRGDALEVDTFLLSCRVLGRGVEHRVLSVLGSEALERGLARVDVGAVPTAKNRPAFDFLRSVGGAYEEPREGGSVFRIPADVTRGATFTPAAASGEAEEGEAPSVTAGPRTSPARASRLQRIAAELFDPREVQRRIEESRKRSRAGGAQGFVAPRTGTEERLAGIFAEVLGVERAGAGDSFFELGGHSLLGTVVLSRIRDAFGVELPLRRIFDLPTVALLAAEIDRLQGMVAEHRVPAIRPVPREGALPLSFSQQRIWFFEQWEPGTAAFNTPLAVWFQGGLRVPLLRESLDRVLARHEVLRSRFFDAGGEPAQEALAFAPCSCPVVDLEGLEPALGRREAERLSVEESRRPFDLSSGQLLRMRLLRLAPREHSFVLTLHHIACDGWSLGVLLREVRAQYEALATGRPPLLPELPVQYADYAVWQRRWLAGDEPDRQIAYWRDRLRGAPLALELPTDRPRRPFGSSAGAQRHVSLGGELTAALKELARHQGCTLYVCLVAAFQVLLARCAHSRDVVVGVLVAGRNRPETEGLIGPFINSLALRTDLEGSPAVREVLNRVHRVALGDFDHQDLPFEKLIEELDPERVPGLHPFFQVLFALQNAPLQALEMPDLELVPQEVDRGAAHLDLFLSLAERQGSLEGFIEHSTALFDAATVERLARHYRNVLAGFVRHPERSIEDLALLGDAERHQLLLEWNDTAAPAVADTAGMVIGILAGRVAAAPGRPAVSGEGGELTYGDLDRRSSRLAHLLRGRGVGAEARVGILLERSPDLIVAILGVLKAGAAYVPLDPAYPGAHKAFLLADAGASVVLTRRALASGLPDVAAEVLDLEEQAAALEGLPVTAPAPPPAPESLAYVMYTSGSTGRAKGIAVPHGALASYVTAALAAYGIHGGDRVLQFCSPSFDTSVEEIFPCLAAGATLVLRTEAMLDPLVLARSCGEEGITFLSIPTAFWHEMTERLAAEGRTLPRVVERVVLGGERALPGRVARWLADVAPESRLLNTYGPTESTVVATVDHLREAEDGVEVSIGRPLSNARVHLLDPRGWPVPVGVPGEIVVAGRGVTRGYLGRPDLTADRFRPDPFGEPGSRAYHTGDLARRLSDGRLQFLRRVDQQVKIRGYRVELGEIEAALAAHSEVEQAVVVAREEAGGGRRLVAYVVAPGGPPAAELRRYLSGRLPEYMVPGTYVALQTLPLTPTGKIDRKALPEPEPEAPAEAGSAAPRTPGEEILAGVFAEVLGRERVGIHDDFFELGGHSLMAIQVVSRLARLLGREVDLRLVFQAPTVAALAGLLGAAQEQGAGQAPLVPAARGEDCELSFAQERLWFLDQLEPDNPAYNLPSALRLSGRLDVGRLAACFQEVVDRHEALRTAFRALGGRPRQVVSRVVRLDLPVIDLGALPEDAAAGLVTRLARWESRIPFDLGRPPLVRATLLRLSGTEHVALVTMHHIVSDGWSLGLFVREVAALYTALVQGLPSPLAPLAIQYPDFALWQRQTLEGEALASQLAYWTRRLADAPPALELPSRGTVGTVQGNRGATRWLEIPAPLTADLRALSRRSGTTLFMTLLAAFYTLLHRYSGSEDVLVGVPVAGRNRPELEPLIGFFVNTLVVRLDLGGQPGFAALLERVRAATLEAYAHQDLPFERLVAELNPDRRLAGSPLFQVMFALQNVPLETVPLPEVTLTPLRVETGTTRFELFLELLEKDGGLTGAFHFSTDLFEEALIARFADHYRGLLATAAAAPGEPIGALPLLTAEEEKQLLVELNDTAVPGLREATFLELFAARVERTPEAVAAVCGGETLTYAGLDRRARVFAGELSRRGLGPDRVVALLADRGLPFLIAMVATFNAGGAYLPLDPNHPAERIRQILRQARPCLAVTAAAYRDLLDAAVEGWDEAPEILGLEETLAGAAGVAPAPASDPRDLAYVIFTSGSTGMPKGAMVEQRGMVNHLRAKVAELGLDASDRVAQTASQCFDISVWQFLAPLAVGGRVVIYPDEVAHDPAVLLDRAAADRVTVLETVPSLLRLMLEEVRRRDGSVPALDSLRWLIPTGEALPPELCREWYRAFPGTALLNAYGPTECSDDVSHYRVPAGEAAQARSIPIGRPVLNTRLFVLNAALAPAPLGVAGELCVGGTGVGRGYLFDPGKTAAVFVPDPCSGGRGARLYRTGDLARLREDGNLEFLGRIDHQVKIRGFRLELGEIEAVLGEHPALAAVVVMARPEASGGQRLVAYVVARPGEAPAAQELRAFLGSRLPDYAIPSAWVTLESLPLTPNGKIDRRALPDVEAGASDRPYVEPRNEVESAVAGIFAAVIGLDRVGAFDNFFDLGGHSLLATQAAWRLRETFGVEIALRTLFEAPTVAELAGVIEERIIAEIEELSEDEIDSLLEVTGGSAPDA